MDDKLYKGLAEPAIELGDIIVSVSTAKRQAKENDHSLQKELRWLVSHGLLHLLGWEHPNIKRLEEMLILQEYLLSIAVDLQHPDSTKEN